MVRLPRAAGGRGRAERGQRGFEALELPLQVLRDVKRSDALLVA
jgi:hypothetical protein